MEDALWKRMSPQQKREMIVDHLALRLRRRQENKRMRRKTSIRSKANKVVHSNRSQGSRKSLERDLLREILRRGRFSRDRRDARLLLKKK